MVSQTQFDQIQGYIRLGQDEGAHLLAGGESRPDGLDPGWFVKPTVFTGVTSDMRIAREDIFGPVLVVIPYQDDDKAVAIANDTPFGRATPSEPTRSPNGWKPEPSSSTHIWARVLPGDPSHHRVTSEKRRRAACAPQTRWPRFSVVPCRPCPLAGVGGPTRRIVMSTGRTRARRQATAV
ncbi:hypothetical protein GCM10010478_63640 [Streptomyces erythrogriseus]|uniref:Aldehyde dehydrogenase domain-containing protein n=1 Tax=Streptomyces erythrogriseus TaxID=284027 RepID=A0ABP6JZR0_9ACTN